MVERVDLFLPSEMNGWVLRFYWGSSVEPDGTSWREIVVHPDGVIDFLGKRWSDLAEEKIRIVIDEAVVAEVLLS